jgi:hypothetical protein
LYEIIDIKKYITCRFRLIFFLILVGNDKLYSKKTFKKIIQIVQINNLAQVKKQKRDYIKKTPQTFNNDSKWPAISTTVLSASCKIFKASFNRFESSSFVSY